jgi:serine/threonine protein kinase
MSRALLHPGQWLRGRHGEIAVLEWVAEGSYARVYRGEGPHGPVAIKLPKSEVEGAAPRLRTEEEVLVQRLHPALPGLRDTGTLPAEAAPAETFWIALQWIPGETLRRRLERGRGLPLVQAVPLLLRIADAVAALHAAGWTHGDLRPDNVLLETATHHAFLVDLGEARRVEGGRGQATVDRRQASVVSRVRQRAPGATLTGPATAASPSVPATDADQRQLGELLAWALTGVDPTREPDRLSRTAGYHPDVVQLWHDSRTGCLPAAALRDRLQRLARHLGLGAART